MAFFKAIKRGYDKVLNALDIGLAWLLIAMFIIITIQVVTRHFTPHPVTWPTDISTYFLVAIGFLAMGHLVRKNGHVAVDLLVSKFPQVSQDVIEVIFSIVAAVTCVITTYAAILMTQNLIDKNALLTASTFYFPKWILLLFVDIGFAITTIELIGRTVYYIRKLKGMVPAETEETEVAVPEQSD